MTVVILSPPRTSTSGRAPVFSITMRFWISVDSLKRPPTLLTIPSSFSSSSIAGPFKKRSEDRAQVTRGAVEIIIEHLMVVLARMGQFQVRLGKTAANGFIAFGVP